MAMAGNGSMDYNSRDVAIENHDDRDVEETFGEEAGFDLRMSRDLFYEHEKD